MSIRKISVATTGTLDAVASGTTVGMTSQRTAAIRPGTLSARFELDVETDTLTVAAGWQVSVDGTTWINFSDTYRMAPTRVVLGTGTAGADAAHDDALPCPPGWEGFEYVRPVLVTAGTTGATVDTYTVTLKAERRSTFSSGGF